MLYRDLPEKLMNTTTNSKPGWLKKKAPSPSALAEMKTMLDSLSLHTVCESAQCPNLGECFSRRTATFLIMGDICTRNCGFCAIRKGQPLNVNPLEPWNVAQAVRKLQLKYAVLTSVTRDDLPDGGATYFANTIKAIKEFNHETIVEVLIPDFSGSRNALKTVVDSCPDLINHNMETIMRLYKTVRPKFDYYRSLDLLQAIKSMNENILTKSGIMLGLGENKAEVLDTMADLRRARCDILTIGQYLPPSSKHHPLVRYISPGEFEEYKILAEKMNFSAVASGPFVRSSYKSLELYKKISSSD